MHMIGIAVLLATAASQSPEGSRFQLRPVAEGVRVHVAKRGLFSVFAHDHDFEVTRWHGTAELPGGDPGKVAVELVLEAGSLRDREEGLSSEDRRKVEGQTAGPEVLDAARFPEITFRSEGATLAGGTPPAGPLRATLHGQLTLHGQTRPVDASLEVERSADGWRVSGSARFKQSDFGIKPYSGAGGTVGVKDAVEVRFAIALQPVGGRK